MTLVGRLPAGRYQPVEMFGASFQTTLKSPLSKQTGQFDVEGGRVTDLVNNGMKATADGYVVGVFSQAWMYGSLDYGKTWTKLEAWVHMSMPEFIDSRRGYLIAAEFTLTGVSDFILRRTEDGGRTWTTGGQVGGSWPWLQPLWTDAGGATLYTVRGGRVQSSTDQGRSWD
jgi:hypothetical protein